MLYLLNNVKDFVSLPLKGKFQIKIFGLLINLYQLVH